MVKSKKDDPQAGADRLAELFAAGLAALFLTDGAAARLRRVCMGDGGTAAPALLQMLSRSAAAGLPDDRLAQALFAPSDMIGAVGGSPVGAGPSYGDGAMPVSVGAGRTAPTNVPTDGEERSGGGRTRGARSLRSAFSAAYDGTETPSASGAPPLFRSMRAAATGDGGGVGQGVRQRVPKRSDAAKRSAGIVSETQTAERKDTGKVFRQPVEHAAFPALSAEGAAFTALPVGGASLSALSAEDAFPSALSMGGVALSALPVESVFPSVLPAEDAFPSALSMEGVALSALPVEGVFSSVLPAEGAFFSPLSAGGAARGRSDRSTDRDVSPAGRTDGRKMPEQGKREPSAAPVLIQPPRLAGQSADPPLSVFGRASLSTREAVGARGDAGGPLKLAVGAANAFVRLTGETTGALGAAGQFASGVWLSPAEPLRGTAGLSGLADADAPAARFGGWSVLENRLGAAVGWDGAPVSGADGFVRRGTSAVSRTNAGTDAPEGAPRRAERAGTEKWAWSSTERRRTADISVGFGNEGQAARLSSFDRLRDAAGGGATAVRAFEELGKASASLLAVADELSSDGQAGGALPLFAGERAAALLLGTAGQTDPDRYAGAPIYLTVNANSTLSSEVDVETYIGELTDRIAAALSASASSVRL